MAPLMGGGFSLDASWVDVEAGPQIIAGLKNIRRWLGHIGFDQFRNPRLKMLKGSFNVRPGRDLHRRVMLYAKRRGLNLNTVVSDALRRYLEREDRAA